jgi:two-component system response regulator
MTGSDAVDILLVEDSPDDVELTRRSLTRCRLANPLHVASDGVEAIDFLFGTGSHAGRNTTVKPKLVLLDLKLPKMDGLEVLRTIRTHEATRTIPVVVLTSSREAPDVQQAYQLGVNSYIVKPVDFEKFVEAVASLGLYWLLLNQPPL